MSSRLRGKLQTPRYPSQGRLAAGLRAIFRANGTADGDLTILARKPNPFGTTFPSEIVKCRLAGDRSRLSLFVKYGTKKFNGVHGHRGNLSYESKVYQEVLRPLRASTPSLYGVYNDKIRHVPWLVLEYLPRGTPASWSKDPKAMIRSARWIGKFQAANEGRVHSARLRFLRGYDSDYYVGWARRTNQLFSHLRATFPWLPSLCREFEEMVPTLLRAPQTVIHGEYFGSNIIYQDGISRPVDWQSTAIAAGEIDLASLTHSWPKNVVRNCEREYKRSRWPSGVPNDFEETLEVARMYMNLRWLGDPVFMSPLINRNGQPAVSKNIFVAMQSVLELRSAGERLGLV